MGEEIALKQMNVSPQRETLISPGARRLLEEHFRADLELYALSE